MSENEKLLPKRRFKEFKNADAWEQRKLGDLAEVRTGKAFSSADFNDDGEYLVVTNKNIQDEANGITSVGDRIDISEATILDNYLLSGDNILVTMDGVNIGKTGRYSNEKAVLAQRVGRLNSEQLEFVCQITISNKFVSEMNKLSVGNAIKHISLKQISDYSFSAPISEEEQEKIGTFFKQLDKTIALHQRKLNKTKALKSAYLSEMFPAEGECEPKRRFAGFTQAWEQSEFQNIFSHIQNNALSRADLNYENGYALNLHYGDILTKFGEYLDVSKNKLPMISNELVVAKYKSSFLKNGDIVIADAAEDETVGKCCEIAGLGDVDMLAGLHTIPCRPNRNFASGYLGYYMNSFAYHDQLLPLIQGTKVSSISKSALKTTNIKYPKEINEQTKIGNFFNQLDQLITLHERKVKKLQNLKRAYLHEMFV
ncbi:restriction endonuclease subunit S [Metabacillus sp. 113a]|uniref:restriction endonuclease subunit S n=1 Tax=Metabacillus sp. 113a TaxID=3404706 RepID=UPI003CF80321